MADDDEALPAGWYREPDAPDTLRWWDGDDWTEDTMPVPSGSARRASGAAGATGSRATPPRAAEPPAAAESAPKGRTRSPAPIVAAPVDPTRPTVRRTRRDAMAEAEADAAGVRIARAVATGGTDEDPPPVEILLDPQPPADEERSSSDPANDPDAEDRPSASVFAPDGDSADHRGSAEVRPTPRRRRPAPGPDGGPGYRRPASETVRILGGGDPAPEAPDEEVATAAAARHRAPAQTRSAGPRPAQRPAGRPPERAGHRSSREPERRGERLAAAPTPAAAATLLRVIVRAGLIALVVGVGFLAYTQLSNAKPDDADTLSKDARTVLVDPDAPRLDQIVLKLADLPRGWTAQATDPQSDDICEGRIPRAVLEPTGIQSAAFTADDGSLIGNVVQEFVDDDTAEAFMDLTARVIDSCRAYSAENSTVQLSPLDFPRFGDQTFAVEAGGTSPGGALHGAIVYVRKGHRVSSVLTLSTGETQVDKTLVERLTLKVTQRMSSKPAVSNDDLPGGTTGELPGE